MFDIDDGDNGDWLALSRLQALQKHLMGQHDQSTHGSWANNDAGSTYEYPVAHAIDAVVAGKVGKVSPLDAVFFMKQMAKRDDNPDLTNLEVVGTRFFTQDNLGIPRDKMPQVPSGKKAEFLAAMDERGVKWERVDVDPQDMHPIQSEISATKAAQIMVKEKGKRNESDAGRIIISSDNYVIDGHHRWAAGLFLAFEKSSVRIPAIRVDMPHQDLIDVVRKWDDLMGIRPLGMGESSSHSTFNKSLLFDIAVQKAKIKATLVDKHMQGQHNQADHGNRSGAMGTGVAMSILDRVKENGGLSVRMLDGAEPTRGYMVARGGTQGAIVDSADFYDRKRGPRILADFLKSHRDLGTGRAYLGLWHNTEDGKVYLDVSDNIRTRTAAVAAGKKRNQISIWDVANFAEINTGGTGELTKRARAAVGNSDSRELFGDDGRADRRLGAGGLGEDGGPFGADGRAGDGRTGLTKHGHHDQSTHGNWAHGRQAEGGVFPKKYANTKYSAETQRLIDSKPNTVVIGRDKFRKGKDSIWNHLIPDGEGGYKVTPEREALYAKIVSDELRGIPKSSNPVFVMMGGGGGSGKGHIQDNPANLDAARALGVAYPEGTKNKDFIVIDADHLKTLIPEFADSVNAGGKHEAPSLAHEESSIITKYLTKKALERGVNVVLDGVGDSDRIKLAKKIAEARDAGYRVDGLYVSASLDNAWAGNMKRAYDSKFRGLVPATAFIEAHREVSKIIPDVTGQRGMAAQFDNFALYDTDIRNGEPRLVATTNKNHKLTIHNKALYADFVAKGYSKVGRSVLMQRWRRYKKRRDLETKGGK